MHDPERLPADLPAPEDDGAARHLAGRPLPDVALAATDGTEVVLAGLAGRTVVYAYPRTGAPGVPPPDGWDAIPGARGCTPQACAFRDHFAELRQLGVARLFGLSTQATAEQREAAERLHLPFPLLSDSELALAHALALPTFTVEGTTLLKRLTLVIDDGVVTEVFYPVFPPDRSPEAVIEWLAGGGAVSRRARVERSATDREAGSMVEVEVDHYGATYERFAAEVYAEVRARAFGEDIGQTGWLTAEEHDLFLGWLAVDPGARLLDVACGSGGPTLRAQRRTGCRVHGIDVHPDAVRTAREHAEREGLAGRASFRRADASTGLPFADAAFDALICVDAINHLPDRAATFREWARLVVPGGRVVFTDPIVVTGPLSNEEIAVRGSIGFFLFVPAGLDESLLAQSGFELVEKTDRTENMARTAARWRQAREACAGDLRRIEGDETFEGQQRFFEVAARLAAERRLSRFAFFARRRL